MMQKSLKFTRFGNPILRRIARRLDVKEITSEAIQNLIADMRYTCDKERAGVGLAAPQVGESIALSVIAIKPTPNRPDRERFDSVIINPEWAVKLANGRVALAADAATTHYLAKHCDIVKLERNGMMSLEISMKKC